MDQIKSNPKPQKWWNCIKQFAGYPKRKAISSMVLDNEIVVGNVLANKINDFFISITNEITPFQPESTESQFEFNESNIHPQFIIDEESVYNKLSDICVSKSSGSDGIPNWVLKHYAYILALPIASLFNASIQQQHVPAVWKDAEVIPIPKISVPADITTDLRPISLTPTLSKICESFVSDWLISSIKNKIDKRQFGSLKNSSTTHNLISLVHHLLKETDASKCAVRVFLLDFSKAFDLIDHNILLHKLLELNVPPTIFNWIKSFLTERRQCVKLGSWSSSWKVLNGVVMVNDLLDEWPDRWKYVDDSTATENVMVDGSSNLQDLVDYIYNWTVTNNMKLNVTKCKEMILDFGRVKWNFPALLIENTEVERVNSAQILGVTIQTKMNWNEHVNKIVKKSGKRLYMLRLLKRANADTRMLSIAFTTIIIRPVLECACQVWHFNIPGYLSDELKGFKEEL